MIREMIKDVDTFVITYIASVVFSGLLVVETRRINDQDHNNRRKVPRAKGVVR